MEMKYGESAKRKPRVDRPEIPMPFDNIHDAYKEPVVKKPRKPLIWEIRERNRNKNR